MYKFEYCNSIGHAGEKLALADQRWADLMWPGYTDIRKAGIDDQRRGVDLWVHRPDQPAIAVDVKTTAHGQDKCYVERWSDECRKRVGWTFNTSHITDYVLYIYLRTKRMRIVNYRWLREQCIENECRLLKSRMVLSNNGYDTITYSLTWRELQQMLGMPYADIKSPKTSSIQMELF